MHKGITTVLTAMLLAASTGQAADVVRPDDLQLTTPLANCYQMPDPVRPDPFLQRMMRYGQLAVQHRVSGLASYYSTFFDGRETANGEIYRNAKYSAAHLTLPLGCWIEVTARATGRKLRMRVNDRGPYVKKFCLDLSQAAAHYLGVDRSADRYVDIRIIALPGEDPLPEEKTAPQAVTASLAK